MKAEKPEIFLGYRKIKSLQIHSNPQFGLIISVDLGLLCIFSSAVWSR